MKTDGEDEQDQAEFSHEFQHFGIDRVAEVSHQNAHEKHKCDTERNSAYFHLAQIDSRSDHERVEHQSACQCRVAGSQQGLEDVHKEM